MNQTTLSNLLKDHDNEQVGTFVSYCHKLEHERKKDGTLRNPWMKNYSDEKLAFLFKKVAKDKLVFDGVNITLQYSGVSYNYIALKNKMFLAYPESKIDADLVYEGDEFECVKKNGTVFYNHTIKSPFKNEKKLEGGYCVIKNKRGEFSTILSDKDIAKHRKVAKTDYIWQDWFKEMALKTVIKKACKQHFADVYQNIEALDNENYELENPLELDLSLKQKIDSIETVDELAKFYRENKDRGIEFVKYITIKGKELKEKESKENNAQQENQPEQPEPAEPTKPTKPTKVAKPAKSAEPIKPTKPIKASNTTKPTNTKLKSKTTKTATKKQIEKDLEDAGIAEKTVEKECEICGAPSQGKHEPDCKNLRKEFEKINQREDLETFYSKYKDFNLGEKFEKSITEKGEELKRLEGLNNPAFV